MTLTFKLQTWVWDVTNCLISVNSYAKLFEIPMNIDEVMLRTKYYEHVFNLWHWSVTLTFEQLTWFLDTNKRLNRLIMVNICAELFETSINIYEVILRKK